MVAINPEMLRELLDEFTEKEAVTREEINIITSQIEELELRIESNKEKLASLARDREKINAMQDRYLQGNWPKVYKTDPEEAATTAAPQSAAEAAPVTTAAVTTPAAAPSPAEASAGPAITESPAPAAAATVSAAPEPVAAPAAEPAAAAVEPTAKAAESAPEASPANPSLSSGSFPTLSAVHSQASINAARASATGLPSMAADAWGAAPASADAPAAAAPVSPEPSTAGQFGVEEKPVGSSTTDNPVIDLQDAVTIEPETPALPSDDPILSSFNSPPPPTDFSFEQIGQSSDTASGAAAASADEGFSWASTSLPAGETNNSQPSTTERLEQPTVLPWGSPPQTQPALDAWGVPVQPAAAASSPWGEPAQAAAPTPAPAAEPPAQSQADQTSTGGWGQGVWGEPSGNARPAPAPAAPWGTPGSSMTGMPAQSAPEPAQPAVQSWEQPAPGPAADTWGQPNPGASAAQAQWGPPAGQSQSAWGSPEPVQEPQAQPSSLARAADGALGSGRGRKRESPAFDWGQSETSGDPSNPQGGSSEEDENVKKLGDKLKGLFNK